MMGLLLQTSQHDSSNSFNWTAYSTSNVTFKIPQTGLSDDEEEERKDDHG